MFVLAPDYGVTAMREYELERWFRLLCFADHYHFGSLWHLREGLLKRRYPGYDQHSTRCGHPAVSINQQRLNSLRDSILMLIGSSRNFGRSVAVKGVFRHSPPEKKTYFKVLRPVSLLPEHFFPRGDLEPEVQRNDFKPRLNNEECAELEKKILSKGT